MIVFNLINLRKVLGVSVVKLIKLGIVISTMSQVLSRRNI